MRARLRRAALLLVVMSLLIADVAARELKPWSGGAAPPLNLRDLQGNRHDLAAYRGKVVLVNFWATWCEPCRDEMPSMQRLAEKLAGKPFAVLAVDMGEGEGRVKEFMSRVPIQLTVLLDRDSSVTKAWKVRILPASFLIGRDGRIHYSTLGDLDWADETVVKIVTDLLGTR
jgi:thiol-disulfide isomerase/thioredoxin